jgi:hypothetical protein
MERRDKSVLAPTIGLAKRNANQKKLVSLFVLGLFTVLLWGQTPDMDWNNSGTQGLAVDYSLIYVNDITAEELIRHPLLSSEEGMSIIQHRTQHGEILDLMELQQCRFTPNRLLELRPFLIFSPSVKLARAEWIRELKSPKGNHSYSNTYYPNRLKSTPNSLGGPWGHSLQLRWNNGQTISVGGSLQLDPGETVRGLNFPFRQWHVRVGNIPLGRGFGMEKLVLGRYNLQLGQGLVQGGLSGFWSAPLLWARKSPDWDLAEKRGFDEYRGHSGVAMAFNFGVGGANRSRLGFGNGKKIAGKIQMIIAVSQDRLSARTDTLGRIQSLISDGMFSTESTLRWFKNTEQWHGTMAVQYQSLRRCTYGISWSGYAYSRPWNAMGEWMDLLPALRAGNKFHYPQFWCTHFQKSGGMWFMNVAMQWQPVKTNSNILVPSEIPSTFHPIAFVMGYVKPMAKNADLSLRYYSIHQNFRPPQGLFNEFQRNHQRLSMTLSSNPNYKYTVKYGAEMGKNLRYNADGEKPVSVIYQLGISAKYSKVWSSELLWQLRRSGDISASEFDAATHYSASPGLDYRMEYGELNTVRSPAAHGFRRRVTVVALYRPAEGWAVKGKISLLPAISPLTQNAIWSRESGINNTTSPNQFSSNQSTQINPNRYKNAMLAAISITHRKPFTPLKITFETLCYQSNSPLYHQPTTTATEIANYVLSGQGYGANCLIEYSFKFKSPSSKKSNAATKKTYAAIPKSNTTNHKASNHKVQTAFRAEFLHKNNSEFPNQPRIFVSLCWK